MARTPTLTNEQREQHIELFYQEPCLWDINDADFMNINSRTAALKGHSDEKNGNRFELTNA
jgi:hypothetical protein